MELGFGNGTSIETNSTLSVRVLPQQPEPASSFEANTLSAIESTPQTDSIGCVGEWHLSHFFFS